MEPEKTPPPPSTSSIPGAGGEALGASGGAARMPRSFAELLRFDGGAAGGGAAAPGPAAPGEARPISELSRRIMAAWGQLCAKGLQVLSGTKVQPEHEHAELVGESLLALARHGSTGIDPVTEARLDVGFSLGLVAVDALLKRMEQGIQKNKDGTPNA